MFFAWHCLWCWATLYFTIQPPPIGHAYPALLLACLSGYFLFGAAALTSIRRRWPQLELQAMAQAVVDIAAMSLVLISSGSLSGSYAAMLVFPVGATALIVPPRLGLFLAAVAAIALLAVQGIILWERGFSSGDFANAGVIGGLIFVVTISVLPIAKRLRESEALIRQRDFDIANLAELNEFIVQHLRESILVVDEQDRIRLINESAGQLLKGETVPSDTLLGEVSPRLLFLLENWRSRGDDWQTATMTLVASGGGAVIQPHFVSLDTRTRGPTLVFLEDTSVLTERLQQSKLASLGRLSASIAHEVRNPVGAMSHAAQLLAESTTLSPQDRRLTQIITSNGERVSQIIGNILQLSRRESARPERLDLNIWVWDFANEFRQTHQLDDGAIMVLAPMQDLAIQADASQLHQIVWNLTENALRHGRLNNPTAPIELRTGRITSSGRPFLEVSDHGLGIPVRDVERIFEPFFTTGHGGTGLGLFIARELAQANGAVLLYEAAPGSGSIFRLIFTDPQRWEL
jgi:two-component system, NtrC family, sensor histidine kinase PilS